MRRRAFGRDRELSRRLARAILLLALLYLLTSAWALLFVLGWFRVGAPSIGLVGVLVVAATAVGLVVYLTSLRRLGASPLPAREAPDLYALVERLCAMSELPKPQLLLIESGVPDVFTTGLTQRRSTLVVTRGLLASLDLRELEAVLAHEFAHVSNLDGAVMTLAWYPVFAGRWLMRSMPRKVLLLGLLPFFWGFLVGALGFYWVSRALTRNLSRARELSADRGAVLLTGQPEYLMSALQKLAGGMSRIPHADLRALEPVNALFIVPTDGGGATHPPLSERLRQLGEIAAELGRPEPPSPGLARRRAEIRPEPAFAGQSSRSNPVLVGAIAFFGTVSLIFALLLIGEQVT